MAAFLKHEHLISPAWNATVWRYMSMAKFLDLILHRRLLFVSASKFTDGYEVTLPQNIVKLVQEKKAGRINDPEIENILSTFEFDGNFERERTLVNCWTLKPTESYAHWKIYLGGDKAGIAIKTNFKNLKNSIVESKKYSLPDIYAGKVKYRDSLPVRELTTPSIITTKREFYSYENELRLFLVSSNNMVEPAHSQPISSPGKYVTVDLGELIERIYVSPFVGGWFTNVLRETVKKINPSLAKKITESSINDQ